MAETEVHFEGKIAQKAIIERDGKVLLVRDPRETEETWEIPGGRMNIDEEPRRALAREVEEELGIVCEVHEVVHMEQFWQGNEGKRAFVIVYRATATPNSALEPDPREVCEIGWFSQEEALSKKLFPEYERALKAFYGV